MHYPNSGMENDMETAMGHEKGYVGEWKDNRKCP